MSKAHLLVVSLSQITGLNDVSTSVNAFAQKTGLTPVAVRAALFFDQVIAPLSKCTGGSYTRQFNAGTINEDEFCNGIRKRLGVKKNQLSDEKVKECWNSMCTFNDKVRDQIQAVKDFLNDNNNCHLIIVTDTNPMHHDFNLKQIGGQEFDNSRVHFINSFDPLVKGKSKFDRAISGILELQLKEILPKGQNISITSFHRSIDA